MGGFIPSPLSAESGMEPESISTHLIPSGLSSRRIPVKSEELCGEEFVGGLLWGHRPEGFPVPLSAQAVPVGHRNTGTNRRCRVDKCAGSQVDPKFVPCDWSSMTDEGVFYTATLSLTLSQRLGISFEVPPECGGLDVQ